MGPRLAQFFASALLLLAHSLSLADGRDIGVCYGLKGDNLPPPKDVINLYKKSQISKIRIYEPYPEVLEALRGSGLSVAMGSRNEDIASFAASADAAKAWVNTNIVPYVKDVAFKWITIGNEVIPGPLAANVPAAMINVHNALTDIGLFDKVKVTTVLPSTVLSASYPPSAGTFAADIAQTMTYIAAFLDKTGGPLFINVYPYFAYSSDPTHISANYTFFTSTTPVVIDGNLQYFNLFDAMVDGFNAALEKINFGNVRLGIAETGWPTLGNAPFTSPANAQAYNKNLYFHVTKNGTPRRPGNIMETFFFAMFNEDLKENDVERNFGFFYPNMQPVYAFW